MTRRRASALGFSSPAVVSRFERDDRPPGVETLLKLVDLFNIDLHWLITGKTPPSTIELAERVKPYAIAHLTDITLRLQKYERERRDLYARNAQGERLTGAIQDVEKILEKEHAYYKVAFEELDALFDMFTHKELGPPDKQGHCGAKAECCSVR